MSLLSLLPLVGQVLDKVIPDPKANAEAKLKLLALQQSGEADLLSKQLSAIVAEAQSADPWTSRARPSFLYVMYLLILWCLPMGILAAFRPETASAITTGMTAYLGSIPDPLYMLFGTGYLGYTAARQYGKAKGDK
jgi:hypothetical protein